MSRAVARRAIFVLQIALALVPAAAPAQPASAPLATGCALLAERAGLLASPEGRRPPAQARDELRALLTELALLEVGPAGAGLRMPWREEALGRLGPAAAPAEIERIARFSAERIAGVCALLDAPPAAAGPPADPARLAEILARPEYRQGARDEGVLYRLLERLRTWFRDIFATDARVQRTVLSFRTAFLAATCLAALWLAIRMARHRLRGSSRRRRDRSGETPAVLEAPELYEQAAAEALRLGNGREAIRLGLLMLLATLERARLAAPGRASTNREAAGQIAARGGSAALSREALEAVDWFDRTWYGLAPVPSDQARGFLARVRALCDRALGADGRGGGEP